MIAENNIYSSTSIYLVIAKLSKNTVITIASKDQIISKASLDCIFSTIPFQDIIASFQVLCNDILRWLVVVVAKYHIIGVSTVYEIITLTSVSVIFTGGVKFSLLWIDKPDLVITRATIKLFSLGSSKATDQLVISTLTKPIDLTVIV